jgi:L-ascorbate metabolism protein UlaG (beta-lactamase superfamily)
LRYKIKSIIVPKCNEGNLLDPSLKLTLNKIGFSNVYEVDYFENLNVGPFKIVSVPFFGEHGDLDIRTKSGYLVNVADRKIYFAADSCIFGKEQFRRIAEVIGDVDILFLGMECDGAPMSWLYGPLFIDGVERTADQSRRLSGANFEQGCNIVDFINPKEVCIYAMGQEPWFRYVSSKVYTEASRPIVDSDMLVDRCLKKNIQAKRLFLKDEGYL